MFDLQSLINQLSFRQDSVRVPRQPQALQRLPRVRTRGAFDQLLLQIRARTPDTYNSITIVLLAKAHYCLPKYDHHAEHM